MHQHNNGQAPIHEDRCRSYRISQRECANDVLDFDAASRKMHVDLEKCVGCGRCLGMAIASVTPKKSAWELEATS
jgi:hypothetical protein